MGKHRRNTDTWLTQTLKTDNIFKKRKQNKSWCTEKLALSFLGIKKTDCISSTFSYGQAYFFPKIIIIYKFTSNLNETLDKSSKNPCICKKKKCCRFEELWIPRKHENFTWSPWETHNSRLSPFGQSRVKKSRLFEMNYRRRTAQSRRWTGAIWALKKIQIK